MPTRPLAPCTTPGCTGRAATGRCDTCRTRRQAATDRMRGTAATRGYDTRWARRRLDYLTRHPRCAICGHLARVADHHPRSRRQLVAAGVADPDADEHLRPLCKPCHDTETARHQPGGWHRAKNTKAR